MITCKRAAEWTSRELDTSIGIGRSLSLGFHRFLCGNCHRFRTQLAEVDRAVGEFIAAGVPESVHLSDDARKRITRALRDEASLD